MAKKKLDHGTPESKSDKFARLAIQRTGKALAAMKQIKNLSNRAAYEFDDDKIERITAALSNGLEQIEQAFSGSAVKTSGFSFDTE